MVRKGHRRMRSWMVHGSSLFLPPQLDRWLDNEKINCCGSVGLNTKATPKGPGDEKLKLKSRDTKLKTWGDLTVTKRDDKKETFTRWQTLNMHQQKVISVTKRESYVCTRHDTLRSLQRVTLMWEIRTAVLPAVTCVSGQRNWFTVCFMWCRGWIPRPLAWPSDTVNRRLEAVNTGPRRLNLRCCVRSAKVHNAKSDHHFECDVGLCIEK